MAMIVLSIQPGFDMICDTDLIQKNRTLGINDRLQGKNISQLAKTIK